MIDSQERRSEQKQNRNFFVCSFPYAKIKKSIYLGYFGCFFSYIEMCSINRFMCRQDRKLNGARKRMASWWWICVKNVDNISSHFVLFCEFVYAYHYIYISAAFDLSFFFHRRLCWLILMSLVLCDNFFFWFSSSLNETLFSNGKALFFGRTFFLHGFGRVACLINNRIHSAVLPRLTYRSRAKIRFFVSSI